MRWLSTSGANKLTARVIAGSIEVNGPQELLHSQGTDSLAASELVEWLPARGAPPSILFVVIIATVIVHHVLATREGD